MAHLAGEYSYAKTRFSVTFNNFCHHAVKQKPRKNSFTIPLCNSIAYELYASHILIFNITLLSVHLIFDHSFTNCEVIEKQNKAKHQNPHLCRFFLDPR